MVEPFGYRPHELAQLTDFQVIGMFMRHSENMKALKTRSDGGNTAKAPPPAPSENVRCGAAYEYLISTGMTPDQAERVIRSE